MHTPFEIVGVSFVIVATSGVGAIVRARRSGTRRAAKAVLGLGCGTAAMAFVLTIVSLVASFQLVGRGPAEEKAAFLARGIEEAMIWSKLFVPLGLGLVFVGGILRGLAGPDETACLKVDPTTFE